MPGTSGGQNLPGSTLTALFLIDEPSNLTLALFLFAGEDVGNNIIDLI